LLIDLDGFKDVNDQCGHDAGDAVLIEIAQRLRATVRAEDSVSRLGGDEFVVLLDHLGTDEQRARDNSLRVSEKLITLATAPIYFQEHIFHIGLVSESI